MQRFVLLAAVAASVAIAAAVYHLAMRDEMLPRFSKDDMPPPPAAPAGGSGQ